MKRNLHTPEQIVKKLREADTAIASGSTDLVKTQSESIDYLHIYT